MCSLPQVGQVKISTLSIFNVSVHLSLLNEMATLHSVRRLVHCLVTCQMSWYMRCRWMGEANEPPDLIKFIGEAG